MQILKIIWNRSDGCILMGILIFFIYCCLSISNKYSERELHEIYDEAYKNYRKREMEGKLRKNDKIWIGSYFRYVHNMLYNNR